MTDTEHERLHQATADVWRYAQAEAAGELPTPTIGIAAADWIGRNGQAYAELVAICRHKLTANPKEG